MLIGSRRHLKNPYIECAIGFTLKYLFYVDRNSFDSLKSLQLIIQADNDFYSQAHQLRKKNLNRSRKSLALLPKFCPTEERIENVAKTGLGSSAALIVSIVSALVIAFDVKQLNAPFVLSDTQLHTIHNLSQFSHCLAQGKIGSGFDVSSACWGSQLYSRFDPKIIETQLKNAYHLSSKDLYATISENAWDTRIQPFQLPPCVHLILADVHAGSNTPLMVKNILNWKLKNPEKGNSTLCSFLPV